MERREDRATLGRGARHGCIDAVHLKKLPLQLSGGMRQRAMIAMALLLEPKLVIMDEPTSALDVVAQRSLMHQVETLRHQLGFAVIFVTHDMSVVSHYSDRLAVMYAGEIVELGPTRRSSTDRSTRTPGTHGGVPVAARESSSSRHRRQSAVARGPPEDVSSRRAARTRTMSVQRSSRTDRYGNHQVRCHLVARTRRTMPDAILRSRTSRDCSESAAFARATTAPIDEVSFEVASGEIVALVGESGSGKSTIGGSWRVVSGDVGLVRVRGQGHGSSRGSREPGEMPMVFQDPFGSINPVLRSATHCCVH